MKLEKTIGLLEQAGELNYLTSRDEIFVIVYDSILAKGFL
jgi:hypothetical protein